MNRNKQQICYCTDQLAFGCQMAINFTSFSDSQRLSASLATWTKPNHKRAHDSNSFDGDTIVCLGHVSKFQRASCIGFVTVATSPKGGQPNFALCSTVYWSGTLYRVRHKK